MNVYFAGIGGVGVGPLAEIALDMGYTVFGSDMSPGLMTKVIEHRGVAITYDQNGVFLEQINQQQPIDWYVYTAAMPPSHPERVAAEKLGIRTAKRDEFLAHVLETKKIPLIAISGTHGKTSTTALMVWALRELGEYASYSIGSTLSWGSSGYYNPKGAYFVYECDEFDRNFLHFRPNVSLITTVDYDHPDTYATKQEYFDAFRQFGQQSNHVITWKNDHSELFPASSDFLTTTAAIALPGEHTRRNATLVLRQLVRMGYDPQKATTAIESFPGVARRFEKLGTNLYTDYAHHPNEIAATLQMARELSDSIIAVYQPHQNTRQHTIQDQYTTCFEHAKQIFWLPTYLTREDPNLEILSAETLTATLANREAVTITELSDDLWNTLDELRHNGNLVLCMGAGSIDAWVREKHCKNS